MRHVQGAARTTANSDARLHVKIAVTRLPAAGSGASHRRPVHQLRRARAATPSRTTQAIGVDLFGAVNDRFDLVAFDPRGIGESSPSIDCKVNQETEGLYSAPFTTPENLDVERAAGEGQVPT